MIKLLLQRRRARYRAILGLYRAHEMKTLHSFEEWQEVARQRLSCAEGWTSP